MNVWVVIVNYNGWDDTQKCLISLSKECSDASKNCSIVLVDNASHEDQVDAMKADFPWCHFIRNRENRGWAGGNNVGIRHAMERCADQIILLNNDTTVSSNLIEALCDAARSNLDYGIIGPVICCMDEPDRVQTDGCRFNPRGMNGFFARAPVAIGSQSRVDEVDIVNGCCMMISAKLVRRIGLIDEAFFLIHEESDYNLRAWQAGFKCGVLNRPLVWHRGSTTFKATGNGIQRYYDSRNLLRLLNKHADAHVSGRGWFRSVPVYLRYLYYRFCNEQEQGNHDSAEAVLQGFYDALVGRYGAMTSENRPGIGLIRCIFEGAQRVRR